MFFFLITLLVLVALLSWLMLAPLEVLIDTRLAVVSMRWVSIGKATIVFEENNFWLRVNVFFISFRRNMSAPTAKSTKKKPVEKHQKKEGPGQQKSAPKKWIKKIFAAIATTRVKRLEVALCPDNFLLAGILYPINFFPLPKSYKVSVGFGAESYLLLRVTALPWRIGFALLRN